MLRHLAIISAVGAFISYPAEAQASWKAACKKDPMNDGLVCQISNSASGVFIYFGNSASPQSICVMGNNFPGKTGGIRIDANPDIQLMNVACVPAEPAISQMLNGQKVITRRYQWPRSYPQDASASLKGFAAAMKKVAALREQIR